MKSMVHLWTAGPNDGAIHGIANRGGGIWEYAKCFHSKIRQCPAMRVRLLRSNMVAENIDAATRDMELLDPVNVSGVFGISLLV